MFGINTFLGTILKSIIILVFADKLGLGLDVNQQVKAHTSGCDAKNQKPPQILR